MIKDGPTIFRDEPFLSEIKLVSKFQNENVDFSVESLLKEYIEIHSPLSIIPLPNQFGG